jgi:hypothetical protein
MNVIHTLISEIHLLHNMFYSLWLFWISDFRHVLYVVCFLLGNSLASEFYMPVGIPEHTVCFIFIGK